MLNETGAHTKQEGMNSKAFGICCVGNFDEHRPPHEQWWLCKKLTRALMDVFEIPIENVRGHRDFAPYKSCPGTLWDMDRFREEL
jgi:N-acetyl-anhydromuramyl-L-alanine amidase AmpD